MAQGLGLVTLVRKIFRIGASAAPHTSHIITVPYQRLTVQNLADRLTAAKNPLQYLSTLRDACQLLKREIGSRNPFFKRAGSLVYGSHEKETVLIGDLHGNTARLQQILDEFGPKLFAGEASLVFLGDIIHHEMPSKVADMAESHDIFAALVVLKLQFPNQVNILLGNHDEIAKSCFHTAKKDSSNRDIDQTVMFEKYTRAYLRAKGFSDAQIGSAIDLYQEVLDNCPLAFVSKGSKSAVYAAHSAVIKNGVTRRELERARLNPDLYDQLLWNVFVERATSRTRTGELRGGLVYNESDVDATIRKLELTSDPADTYIISAHMPALATWHYKPFAGKPNHRVIHSNVEISFGVLVVKDGVLAEKNLPVLSSSV